MISRTHTAGMPTQFALLRVTLASGQRANVLHLLANRLSSGESSIGSISVLEEIDKGEDNLYLLVSHPESVRGTAQWVHSFVESLGPLVPDRSNAALQFFNVVEQFPSRLNESGDPRSG